MTSSPAPLPTFRDPDGQVEIHERNVVRRVRPAARAQALELIESPFFQQATHAGQLTDTLTRDDGDGRLIFEHPRVFFPSYPWEWSSAQWIAAGELTLDLCEQAIRSGWILKDATPLNVLFEGSRPVFVDVLSFDRRNPRSPVWEAQAQFIRTFLLPLIAWRRLGWPLGSALLSRDGISPEQLLPSMSWHASMRPSLFWNVTLPAFIDRRMNHSERAVGSAKARECAPEIATELLLRRIRKLRRQLVQLAGAPTASRWSRYQENLAHYEAADQQEKQAFVEECLASIGPVTVLDIGANTGTYSFLAARHKARVVAIDTDEASVERLYRRAAKEAVDVQPLVVNMGRPTPATGWLCREQLSFLERTSLQTGSQFDVVLMLAVIHHLLLTEQVPLPQIAELCSTLARRALILEWVPPHDPMFRELLRGRDALYGHLAEADLLSAFSRYFHVEKRKELRNGRVLFLLAKNG